MLESVRMFTLKEPRRKSGTWDLLPYYNILHTEYLASYTNTLQLTDYQHFDECKILQILPTHNLHTTYTPHTLPHGTNTGG